MDVRTFHLAIIFNNYQIIKFRHFPYSDVACKFTEIFYKKETYVILMKNLIECDAMEIHH